MYLLLLESHFRSSVLRATYIYALLRRSQHINAQVQWQSKHAFVDKHISSLLGTKSSQQRFKYDDTILCCVDWSQWVMATRRYEELVASEEAKRCVCIRIGYILYFRNYLQPASRSLSAIDVDFGVWCTWLCSWNW